MNRILSKTWGWIVIIFLVLLDASLDVIFAGGRGLESPVWKPIATLLGINNPLFMTPLVLIIFYFLIKGGAWLARKVDKITKNSEELVLTALVIVYGLFDLLFRQIVQPAEKTEILFGSQLVIKDQFLGDQTNVSPDLALFLDYVKTHHPGAALGGTQQRTEHPDGS